MNELNLDVYSYFIPALIGLWNLKYLKGSIFCFFITILISLAFDLGGIYLTSHEKNANLLYNIFIPISNFFWWLCFYLEMKHIRNFFNFLVISIVVSTSLIFLTYSNIHLSIVFNTIGYSISSLQIILVCLVYLVFIGFKSQEFRLEYNRLYLVACGLLLYQSFNISIITALNYLQEEILVIWSFKKISLIILNLFFGYVLYIQKSLFLNDS